MKWDDIKVFLAIAESGSLSGAATRLGQNHSTVFRRLNALEQDLETRLFERLPAGYVLTPVGERMLTLAQPVSEAVDTIYREVAGQDIEPQGTVVVTTAANLARLILPAVANRIQKEYPRIHLSVSVGDHDYDMNRREADLAIRATMKPPDNLIGKRLADVEWWFYSTNKKKSDANISGKPIIGADRELMRVKAFQWLETRHASDIVMRTNDIATMVAFAENGAGIALLPSDYSSQKLIKIKKVNELEGQIWMLTHPDLRNVTRVKVVWDTIQQIIEDVL